MTAHVAERGEGRGRVVLGLDCSADCDDAVIAAAILVARSFGAEIEGFLIEDRQIFDAAGYAFAREISPGHDTAGRPLMVDEMSRRMALSARAAGRRITELAAAASVPLALSHVRDTPVGALVRACQAAGPWNVVALGEPLSTATLDRLEGLFERVGGMTGVVIAARSAARSRRAATPGPVVAVVEHPDRLAGMVRTASRIAAGASAPIVVAVLAESRAGMSWLAAEVRAALPEDDRLALQELAQPGGGVAVIAESLRRLHAGFVIAELGGLVLPPGGDMRPLAATLACPLLVVR